MNELHKFTLNDKVTHNLLGTGVIKKCIQAVDNKNENFGYYVMFDNTPPIDYNGSNNPCFILSTDLMKNK